MDALKQSSDSKVGQESVIKSLLKVWRMCLLVAQASSHSHRSEGWT